MRAQQAANSELLQAAQAQLEGMGDIATDEGMARMRLAEARGEQDALQRLLAEEQQGGGGAPAADDMRKQNQRRAALAAATAALEELHVQVVGGIRERCALVAQTERSKAAAKVPCPPSLAPPLPPPPTERSAQE